MKKLMFVAAALTAGFAMAIESQIVGYNTSATSGRIYVSMGPTFVDVGSSDGTFTLGAAMVPGDGYDWQSDKLYLVNPDTCEADNSMVYLSGVWYDDINSFTPMSDEPLAVGTGFQSDFSGEEYTFTSSGQVHGDGYSIDCNGKIYQFIVNATGRTVTWSEISIDGGDYDWQGDKIYIVNPETCEADSSVVNISGIWYDDINSFAVMDDEEIIPGEGFQTDFSGGDIILNFPATFDVQ